jgi:hypothetical protein
VDDAGRWIALGLGIVIVVGTAGSLIRTLILPRGLTSRLSVLIERNVVWRSFIFVANRFDTYETKDKILALGGPVSLLALLVVWLGLFLLGYALMLWPLIEGGFVLALREAGSSFFTLGFAGTEAAPATIVNFFAAATGLIVIALQIAYLPTLYGSFNRRETLVTLLQSRAGAPAWGPELLIRSHLVNLMGSLPDLYADWERWAADVAESHTNYPILVWWRSPHPLRSWVLGLVAVMDSAAMYNALAPSKAPIEGRLVLRMGFTCLRSIAEVMRIPFDPDPLPSDPIDLTYEEFAGGVHLLEDAGFQMERTPEQAWDHFKGWRVNYEGVAYALADAIVAPPGPWSGPRRHLPGMAIIPQRPPDRRPNDPGTADRPNVTRFGWHA